MTGQEESPLSPQRADDDLGPASGFSLRLPCCSEQGAAAYIEELTELALHGDDDALACLPSAIAHWLGQIRPERWGRL